MPPSPAPVEETNRQILTTLAALQAQIQHLSDKVDEMESKPPSPKKATN